MKEIKVLGSGCTKCKKTAEIIEKIADELNVKVHVTKESSPETILAYGVMITPAVIIDEINVHSGTIPKKEAIKAWLKE